MQNKVIIILGRKGGGKTTLAREYVRLQPRVLILDALDEYREGFVTYDTHRLADFLELHLRLPFMATVKVRDDETFERALRCAQYVGPVEPLTVLIEEADLRCSPQYMVPALDKLIRYGRHWGVSIVALARRPAEISRHLTAQADTIVSFQTVEPRDLDFFRARCSDAFAELLPRLEPYAWVSHGDPLGIDNGREVSYTTPDYVSPPDDPRPDRPPESPED